LIPIFPDFFLMELICIFAQLEKENMELYREVQENVAVQDQADGKTAEIFAFFDEVWKFFFFFSQFRV
jgi:hypothetical protein